MSKLPPKPA